MLATPLGSDKEILLQRLIEGLDASALSWLSGYVAGRAASPQRRDAITVGGEPATARLTIVYGTQTGNSRALAERLQRDAEAAGLAVRTVSAGRYPLRELKKERLLYVVISTQGDGEPPDDARAFYEFVLGKARTEAPSAQLRSAGARRQQLPEVLRDRPRTRRTDGSAGRETASGQGGLRRRLRARRAELDRDRDHSRNRGARRFGPRHASDAASDERPLEADLPSGHAVPRGGAREPADHRPGRAEGRSAPRVSLADSGLTYEPGDALGFRPRNPPELVDAVLETLGLDGAAEVTREGRELPAGDWLSEELELTRAQSAVLAQHAALAQSEELEALLAPAGAEGFSALLKSIS